jgi:hypothetical protein
MLVDSMLKEEGRLGAWRRNKIQQTRPMSDM